VRTKGSGPYSRLRGSDTWRLRAASIVTGFRGRPFGRFGTSRPCARRRRMSQQIFPDTLTLLHNPRCSKSRTAKALLEERGIVFRERLYLEEPLSRAELSELAGRLGQPPAKWVRSSENAYKETGLSPDTKDDTILAAMARHPILIERPILISSKRAVVGRPPERVLELLD